MNDPRPFLRRVSIRNYKSIAACDVELGKFTVIVGRNGSGKSNFLDAIRFVAESLDTSLDHAVRARGGIDDVLHRTGTSADALGIEFHFELPDGRAGVYAIEVLGRPQGRYRVRHERLQILAPGCDSVGFETRDGEVTRVPYPELNPTAMVVGDDTVVIHAMPKPAPDRLYLVTLSGGNDFRDVYEALKGMAFYNLSPDQIRQLHAADSSDVLRHDGGNLASVAGRLFAESPALKERLLEYLNVIVPEVDDIRRSSVEGFDYLSFQINDIGDAPLRASAMSDGTLRVIGNLIAAMQFVGNGQRLPLVALEEPETALHPAASAALLDALREAAVEKQIIITTHSADLLDELDLETDTLVVAQLHHGRTEIDAVDSVGASAIRDHLFSAGELLRLDQLRPIAPAKNELLLCSRAELVP